MNKKMFFWILFIFMIGEGTISEGQTPNTFSISGDKLIINKLRIKTQKRYLLAEADLLKEADTLLKSNYFSITWKSKTPPSGSLHDYYSISAYRWPDSSKPNGLPYIVIDGKVNPEKNEYPDSKTLNRMSKAVFKLALAYYYTNNEVYARKATRMLEVFFLNKKTRMNPNFEYSQMVPGKSTSGGATISATPLISVVEGIQLLRRSSSWTDDNQKNMEKWFSELLDWMLNSSKGKNESLARNNIGSYYLLQTTVYALFIGDYKLADSIMVNNIFRLIEDQINDKGEMPYELKRATPWNYVTFNITALDKLVEVGKRLNLSLLDYTAQNGGSIKKAFDWLIPFAEGKKKWNYGHKKVSENMVMQVLCRIESVNYSYIIEEDHSPVKCRILLY